MRSHSADCVLMVVMITALPAAAQVRLSWAEDATLPLQDAISRGEREIVVPYEGKPWVIRPVQLRSDLTILFEPGVVVEAKAGEFRGIADSLMTGRGVNHVTLRGYGATLRMRKADYAKSDYKPSQWRHCLVFNNGSTNITIEGLTLASSGGDGIYIGANSKTHPPCRNVVIRNVVCDDNFRQGISVTSVDGLLIENCILKNTSGSNPQAGIDIEPNLPHNIIRNVVVRNCQALDNAGSGLLVGVSHLEAESQPVSILFENCLVRNSGMAGIRVKGKKVGGLLLFRNCTVENSGEFVNWNVPILRYENCKWLPRGGPLHIEGHPNRP
ncbi:MAG: right-handed parallel beta-helix repeat-containing protein [Phycisphaerae bacterium]|nr:right-handed parallel beta-helix repeat-containing protein [Phycisphaerae bacterium]